MKHTLFLLLLCSVLALPVSAQRQFRLEHPALTVSLPSADRATGRAVIVCPGGGYHFRAEGHEGLDWAPYFNRQGIAFILLHYRMPEKGQPSIPPTGCRGCHPPDARQCLGVEHPPRRHRHRGLLRRRSPGLHAGHPSRPSVSPRLPGTVLSRHLHA